MKKVINAQNPAKVRDLVLAVSMFDNASPEGANCYVPFRGPEGGAAVELRTAAHL
jgi:hypothetical protein